MSARGFCGHCGADWADVPTCDCRVAAERVVETKSSSALERFASVLRVWKGISPHLAADIATGRARIGEA